MTAAILILRLDGVLQSWGERAHWDFRDSNTMPTKSGVIGLLSCAMGLPRWNARILELSNNIKMGVRADRNGIMLEDFHTVTGERGFLFNTKGEKRNGDGGATIITPRQYLQDACFTVMLSAEKTLIEECATALQNPIWPIYLGRKSCVPSCPVFKEISNEYMSIVEALSNYPLCKRHEKSNTFLCEYEDITGSILRRDAISINANRNYGYRRVKNIAIDMREGA